MPSSPANFNIGGKIAGGGTLNIGRRADLAGSYFTGTLSNFNIWSRFLPTETIKNLASSCQPLTSEGDIVAWSEVKRKAFSGDVQKYCPGTCYL